ncbi:hypothetical protein [Streptomyces sp. CC208A]|uniref:hypothetical protein n=1 Tax=Streptomyces sp. CC208A TaxID=3044573 RepID=UPI0024A9112A|nr:hypothetical protein [Streptomyces sp. CC208A]
MRIRKRCRAAVVALPLLLAVVGCESGAGAERAGGPGDDGGSPSASPSRLSVFDVPVRRQPTAAGAALADSGSARFTTTVTYVSAGKSAVERTDGVLDWRKDAARAERVLRVPAGFPAGAAEELGLTPGRTDRQSYAVEGNEVAYRTKGGTWLRYSASDSKKFADRVGGLLNQAGDAAPWGRTLAEVLKVSSADGGYEALPGGGRRYRAAVDGYAMRVALPSAVGRYVDGRGSHRTVVVDLDREGRLVRAEADLKSLLAELHGQGELRGLTELRVELSLTGHGRPVTALVPSTERFEAAQKVLTALDEVEPGSCASIDTGLDHPGLVRSVPCGSGADLRVFSQQRIDKTVRDTNPEGLGRRLATEGCRRDFREVPAAWTSGARPAGGYQISGKEKLSYAYTGPDATVRGDFTCYVTLR